MPRQLLGSDVTPRFVQDDFERSADFGPVPEALEIPIQERIGGDGGHRSEITASCQFLVSPRQTRPMQPDVQRTGRAENLRRFLDIRGSGERFDPTVVLFPGRCNVALPSMTEEEDIGDAVLFYPIHQHLAHPAGRIVDSLKAIRVEVDETILNAGPGNSFETHGPSTSADDCKAGNADNRADARSGSNFS